MQRPTRIDGTPSSKRLAGGLGTRSLAQCLCWDLVLWRAGMSEAGGLFSVAARKLVDSLPVLRHLPNPPLALSNRESCIPRYYDSHGLIK